MVEASEGKQMNSKYVEKTLSKKDSVTHPVALEIQNFFNTVGLPLSEIHSGIGLQNKIVRNAGMRVGCLYQRIFGDGIDKDDKEQKRKKYLERIISGDSKLGVIEHFKLIDNARLLIPHALLLGQLNHSDRLTIDSLLSLSVLCTEHDQDVRKKSKKAIRKDPVAVKLYEQYGSFFNRNVVNINPLTPVHQEPIYSGPSGSVRL